MNFKRTGIKFEASTFDKIKAHCVLSNIGLSEWVANAAVAMYNNETAAPLGKGETNEQQQEKNKRIEHD